MSIARRIRLLVLIAILAALVIFYIVNGPEQTKNSAFYTRTVALMEAKARGHTGPLASSHQQHQLEAKGGPYAELLRKRGSRNGKPGSSTGSVKNHDDEKHAGAEDNAHRDQQAKEGRQDGQKRLMDIDEDLRERLKEAEMAAKKSADDKYRALKDIESEVNREREARLAEQEENEKPNAGNEKSIAGRKKMSVDDARPGSRSHQLPVPGSDDEDPEEARVRRIFVEILSHSPVTIFSKSFCPFSGKAKHILLQAYSILPPPHVVEVDLHKDGRALQELLQKTTGRRTVPNVLIRGKSMGGGDETELLWKSGELPARIKQIGGKKIESIKMNYAWGEHGKKKDGT